jgi:hypothetical protein
MILRFVQGSGVVSRLIMAQEKTAMPFTPSHVEALTIDKQFYIGAHIDGGVQKRPIGYDKDTTVHELLLDLGAARNPIDSAEWQDQEFEKFLISKIGEPYDWLSIPGFLVPEHLHLVDHIICSALQTFALRKCLWLPWPVAAPFHLIDPRDLLLMISARMQVPGV